MSIENDQNRYLDRLYGRLWTRIKSANDPRAELAEIRREIEDSEYCHPTVRDGFGKIRHLLIADTITEVIDREAAETHGPTTVDKAPIATPPPGYWLDALARLFLTRDAFTKYVEPVIADMQAEHAAAKDAGQTWRARWIHIRGYGLVIPGWLYAFLAGRFTKLFQRGPNR